MSGKYCCWFSMIIIVDVALRPLKLSTKNKLFLFNNIYDVGMAGTTSGYKINIVILPGTYRFPSYADVYFITTSISSLEDGLVLWVQETTKAHRRVNVPAWLDEGIAVSPVYLLCIVVFNSTPKFVVSKIGVSWGPQNLGCGKPPKFIYK